MSRKGRKFENAYEWLYSLDDNYRVTSPAFLYDKVAGINREIDVLVEYTDNQGVARKISIECRDRKSTQDVMWIEQLQQKREDIGLDYIIAATTSHFSEAAIKKAKYHGVIIEQAEMLNKNTVESNVQKYFFDAFFLYFSLEKLFFYTCNNERIPIKDFLQGRNIFEKHSVLQLINHEFYFSLDPNKIMEDNNINTGSFFSKGDSSMEMNGTYILQIDEKPNELTDVMAIEWKVRVTPHKVSLPLTDSISVFDGETHSNKDYRAIYGNNEEYLRIGYLNNKLFTELHLKERKYMRLIYGNLNLNTIIPGDVDTTYRHSFEDLAKTLLGEFDMKNLGI